MKLSNKALTAISSRDRLLALAIALDFSEQWIRRLLEANKENGPLTTVKSIQLIKSMTGLDESEILEELEATTNPRLVG